MKNEEFKSQLEERTLAFAVNVLNLLSQLPNANIYWSLVDQLCKASTSIGANYREANRSESRNDFIHKIGIVEKESSESEYWLLVLLKVEFIDTRLLPELKTLHDEATELTKLFSTINRTAKLNKTK